MKCVCAGLPCPDTPPNTLNSCMHVCVCVCVCVCSCAYHLLCHLSNWTDCLASQHQMVPAVVRHCRIQPYISCNNAYTHTYTHTCIHTSRLISETDLRFTSFHTKTTSRSCRLALSSTFFFLYVCFNM